MATFALTSGYTECRPAYKGEDYTLVITVAGSGSISGWTLAGHLWNTSGVEITSAVAVVITDAANRIITATIAAQTFAATTYYAPLHFEVIRTDTGSRTVVAWGTLEVTDPQLIGPPG